ncbi:MAG: molybdopterin molybdotransferase MoeA [Actinomycetota bacterium]
MLFSTEAQQKILNSVKEFRTGNLNILESLGFVLAQNIKARKDIPTFDISLKKGYAVRTIDIKGADPSYPVKLRIIKGIPPEDHTGIAIEPGFCIPISACDQIPGNCDCVVTRDNSEVDKNYLLVYTECQKGENIKFQSEDINRSDVLLKKGKVIFPEDISMLAFLGMEKIEVITSPYVGIISAGGRPNAYLNFGCTRDITGYLLSAKLKELKVFHNRFGIASEAGQELEKKIAEALKVCGVLLVTGGSFLNDLLQSMGAGLIFKDVSQKPYSNFAFFNFKGNKVFVLPQELVPALMCFEIYIRPFLKKIMGHEKIFRNPVKAKALNAISHKKGATEFRLALLFREEGKLFFEAIDEKYYGRLTSLINADGIARFPGSMGDIEKNSEIDLFLLKEQG